MLFRSVLDYRTPDGVERWVNCRFSERRVENAPLELVRVATSRETRSEIMQIVDIYRGSIVDVARDSMVVQIVGAEDKVDSMIDLLQSFGIQEMVRTGRVALERSTVGRARHRAGSAVWKARSNGKAEDVTAGRQTTGGV